MDILSQGRKNLNKKKVLILGGTRFFGKNLAELILQHGWDLTLATRGNIENPFPGTADHITVDRTDPTSMHNAFSSTTWDVVFDQICMDGKSARISCDVFGDRVGNYIMTSSSAVYQNSGIASETDFDAFRFEGFDKHGIDYGKNKMAAESIFSHYAKFPYSAARLAMVLGKNSTSFSLESLIYKIVNRLPISFLHDKTVFSLTHSFEAARFLFWLAENPGMGPINCSSDGNVTFQNIIQRIELKVNKKAILHKRSNLLNLYDLTQMFDLVLKTDKAKNSGFEFDTINYWLDRLIESHLKESQTS